MRIHCPHCGTEYEVPEEDSGRKALCEVCNNKFVIRDSYSVEDSQSGAFNSSTSCEQGDIHSSQHAQFRCVGSNFKFRYDRIEHPTFLSDVNDRGRAVFRRFFVNVFGKIKPHLANLAIGKLVHYIAIVGTVSITAIASAWLVWHCVGDVHDEDLAHEGPHTQELSEDITKVTVKNDNSENPMHKESYGRALTQGTNTFQYVRDKIAIIDFDDGSTGTGFFLRMAGGVYFVSNEHVMRGCASGRPTILGINGRQQFSARLIEISKDRDLTRWVVADDSPCLALAEDLPNVGDDVSIYGNSEGGGVVTEIKGRVLGASFERIETDGKFVSGNSGSPLVNSLGKVLGVATLMTNYNDDRDWTKKGTRFNEVRRYAERVNIEPSDWFPMLYEDYVQELNRYNDYDFYMTRLIPYCLYLLGVKPDSGSLTYSEHDENKYCADDGTYHKAMMSVVDEYKKTIEAAIIHEKLRTGNNTVQQRTSSSDADKQEELITAYNYEVTEAKAIYMIRYQDFYDAVEGALSIAKDRIMGMSFRNPRLGKFVDAERKAVTNGLKALALESYKTGDVYEKAIECLTTNDKYKQDDLLGSFLLYHLGKKGDDKAKASFVDMWIRDLLAEGVLFRKIVDDCFVVRGERIEYYIGDILNDERIEHCVAWFENEAKKGREKAWYVVGCKDIQIDRNIYNAIKHFKGSKLCMGWLRAGRLLQCKVTNGKLIMQDNGENDKLVLKCLMSAIAEEFKDEDGYITAKGDLGCLRSYSKDRTVQSWSAACIIWKELLDIDYENAEYAFSYAEALLNSTEKVDDIEEARRWLNKSANGGHKSAKKCLAEFDRSYWRQQILRRAKRSRSSW